MTPYDSPPPWMLREMATIDLKRDDRRHRNGRWARAKQLRLAQDIPGSRLDLG